MHSRKDWSQAIMQLAAEAETFLLTSPGQLFRWIVHIASEAHSQQFFQRYLVLHGAHGFLLSLVLKPSLGTPDLPLLSSSLSFFTGNQYCSQSTRLKAIAHL